MVQRKSGKFEAYRRHKGKQLNANNFLDYDTARFVDVKEAAKVSDLIAIKLVAEGKVKPQMLNKINFITDEVLELKKRFVTLNFFIHKGEGPYLSHLLFVLL